jgi:hypothetical protein
MGQYGNQPDFGTRAQNATPTSAPDSPEYAANLNSAALYIGTGGTLVCRVVGGNAGHIFAPENVQYEQSGYTVFTNIPNGTFFPVIVSAVWISDANETSTTCSGIVALY